MTLYDLNGQRGRWRMAGVLLAGTFPRLHPRHRVDASLADAAYALVASARRRPADAEIAGALVCLSVRSAFDLLLASLGLPPGDEVLVSAVTHPDMTRIIELHGLRPVPVDIEPHTLAPAPEALRAAVTGRSRVVLVAHLFGARVDLGDVAQMARTRGLLLVEDCAQSVEGPLDQGDRRADVSLFSYGFIKTATALGGALAWVRVPELKASMRARQERWPVQPRAEYAAKALKCAAAVLLANPAAYGFVARGGRDPGALVRTAPPGDDAAFAAWLRRRPCGGLGTMLRRRLRRFPTERVRRQVRAGEHLASGLPPTLFRPGTGSRQATQWLFPVVTGDPDRLIRVLRAAGFDAIRGTSQIGAVPPEPPGARWLMAGIVFVPAYPEIPPRERLRLAAVLRSAVDAPAVSPALGAVGNSRGPGS